MLLGAPLLGARTLGAPGIVTRSTDATRAPLLGARTLLGAPGIASRSKDATSSSRASRRRKFPIRTN